MPADDAPARRHFIIACDDSGRIDRAELEQMVLDMASVLASIGGQVVFAAQRAKIDEISGQPVAITAQIVGEWQAHSALPFEDWTEAPTTQATGDVGAAAPPVASTPAAAPVLDELGEPEDEIEDPAPPLRVSAAPEVAAAFSGDEYDPEADPSLLPADVAEVARG